MLHFLELDEFTLVIPGPDDISWYEKNMGYAQELNREFLKTIVEPPKGGRISGSFIYSHPPDYVGRHTMTWTVTDWRNLFQEMREMGVDTAIYQAAVWLEVKESNYPSKIFPDFKTWDSIGPLCEAAAQENVILYLGGLGNLMCFDENATPETYKRDRDAQLACFKELKELYGGGFQGFYMSPETGYPGPRQPEREALLNQYFKQVCEGVKAEMPGLPILMSPGTYYTPGHDQDIYNFLVGIFKDCPVDFMAPQDSIGTFGNSLPHLRTSFDIWDQVCRDLGFTLWLNAESWYLPRFRSCRFYAPGSPIIHRESGC